MHAILALGASHLSLAVRSGRDYTSAAIQHRGRALRCLNEMMAREECNSTEINVMLAACYALTFQANYMTDGLFDFAVMVRGCAIMTERLSRKYENNAIFELDTEEALRSILETLDPGPVIDTAIIDTFLSTLESVQPLLRDDAHYQFYNALADTLKSLRRSSREGYLVFTRVYRVWYSLDNAQFLDFLSPQNTVSQILFLHHIALQLVMWPILARTAPQMTLPPRVSLSMLQWGEGIYENLPESMRGYVHWQAKLIASARTAIDNDNYPPLALKYSCKAD